MSEKKKILFTLTKQKSVPINFNIMHETSMRTKMFVYQHSLKYLLLCSTDEETSLEQHEGELNHRINTIFFYFWVNHPFKPKGLGLGHPCFMPKHLMLRKRESTQADNKRTVAADIRNTISGLSFIFNNASTQNKITPNAQLLLKSRAHTSNTW